MKHCSWSVEPVEGGEEDDAVVGESDAEEEDDDQMVCSCIILKLSPMVSYKEKDIKVLFSNWHIPLARVLVLLVLNQPKRGDNTDNVVT